MVNNRSRPLFLGVIGSPSTWPKFMAYFNGGGILATVCGPVLAGARSSMYGTPGSPSTPAKIGDKLIPS